ncbi:J domain-containing protein [Nocardioides zeicaulis]|uniref:J domain-containing protein n=1 Tax=Nocardioides zeicaulis TaxID=1776857 RepID=A0ABV6E3D4_9ACTN
MSDLPTWYDLLDVPREASTDEVRAAWKAQIADLEPGERRFDALNRAARVLLDPAARAAYDAEHPVEPSEPGEPSRAGRAVADEPAESEGGAPVRPRRTARLRRSSTSRVGVPGWLLGGLGVLAAGLVAVASWTWAASADSGAGSTAAREAQVAAERAVVPVLSYDHRHLDEDQRAAEATMTGRYRQEYDKLFTVLKENAPQTRTTVSAEVVASGIVRASDDRVQVLVFVDRPTTNKLLREPVVYKDQVTVSMQRVDGEWLVDDLVTSPVPG